jgi:hypothetical protein
MNKNPNQYTVPRRLIVTYGSSAGIAPQYINTKKSITNIHTHHFHIGRYLQLLT